MFPGGSLFPWFSPVRKGQSSLSREGTINAMHVMVCGSVNGENVISSPEEDILMGRRQFFVMDSTGGQRTLFDVRDWIGCQREDLNDYYLQIALRQDLDGDVASGDDIEIALVSDGVGAEVMRIRSNSAGIAYTPWDPSNSKIYLPMAYVASIDAAWRTLVIEHLNFAPAETHTTHVLVEIYKRPTTHTNEVIT